MKTKVLIILGEPIVNGGQESFIINMYNNMDLNKIQFDILTPFYCENNDFIKQVKNNGGNVIIKNYSFEKNRKKNFKKCINEYLKKNHYNIVHIQSGSIYSLMSASKICYYNGIKHIIVHSHCGGFKNIKYLIIKILSKHNMNKYPTEYWACSKLAAEWKFPRNIIKRKKFKVMKNAIDTTKIYYSEKLRKEARGKLNIKKNQHIIGHIGRFSIQKNHNFLIEIFNEISKKDDNAILLLIGSGELEKEIRKKVELLNLNHKVKFLGIRNDINELLNAMDIFLLPSFFEGLPVVGVEAQATGLMVVTSDNVTKELPIQDLVEYCKLEKSAEEWAKLVCNHLKKSQRRNTTKEIKKQGYDVKIAAKYMQECYKELDR